MSRIQVHTERMLALTEVAWPDRITDKLVQCQLVDIFVDGLTSDTIARKLMCQQPDTMEAGVKLAATEQNLDMRFKLRNRKMGHEDRNDRVEEPMEVDKLYGKCGVILMFRSLYDPQSLCFPVLCSPVSMFPSLYVPLFYVPRSLCSPVLCSPVPMFPNPYVPQYLCSTIPMFPGTYLPRVFFGGRGGGRYKGRISGHLCGCTLSRL